MTNLGREKPRWKWQGEVGDLDTGEALYERHEVRCLTQLQPYKWSLVAFACCGGQGYLAVALIDKQTAASSFSSSPSMSGVNNTNTNTPCRRPIPLLLQTTTPSP